MGDIASGRPRALLTLVRHAESQANVDRVLQGVADAPISSKGEEQLRKLEAGWRPGANALPSNVYQLPSPTLIVTSPLGRARKTSNAIARGCGVREVLLEDSITFRSPPCQPPASQAHEHVLVDAGLSERNFGAAESTRNSQPVDGYMRPPRTEVGRAESYSQFERRVNAAGWKWIEWLKAYAASSVNTAETQPCMSHNEQRSQDKGDAEPLSVPRDTEPGANQSGDPQKSRPEQEEASTSEADMSFTHDATAVSDNIPHLVLVSHGQWINAFLTHHFPEMRTGRDAYYIRSLNTALFTMELGDHDALRPLRLVRKNDTSHLGPAVPRAKKRRATQSTRLTDLWHAPPE